MQANMGIKTWVKRWISRVFRHEGTPGEFIVSILGIIYALLAHAAWGLITPLRSMDRLSVVVPPDMVLSILIGLSVIHLLFLMCDGRWSRWATCSLLFLVWLTLSWNLMLALPWHPLICLYLIPAGVYAYGTMYLLTHR